MTRETAKAVERNSLTGYGPRADLRCKMAESSDRVLTGPDQVEQEFAETLRQAAYLFENEKDGRFQGSILACRAVARFIHQRKGGAELAGPFLQIAAAFQERERGGNTRAGGSLSRSLKVRPRGSNRADLVAQRPLISISIAKATGWEVRVVPVIIGVLGLQLIA
jgi:hypothetical protein